MDFSLNVIRIMKSRRLRWAWHVACMGELSNAILWSNIQKVKRMLGRSGHRWMNNIKI
jgi:hypothetical protein